MSQTNQNFPSSPACVQVDYEITGNLADYRTLTETAAPHLARMPGLLWKLWLLDEAGRRGGGVYLFQDEAAARVFLDGPILTGLRRHPAVSGVTARQMPVLPDLSRLTGGQRAGL